MKKWIINNYVHISNIISAIASILLSLLASYIYDKMKSEEATGVNIYIVITLIIFAAGIIILLSLLSKHIKNRIFKDEDLNKYIQKAYLAIQDYSLESQSYLQEKDSQDLNGWFLQNIQSAVNKCYEFFYSSFGGNKILIEEIKFEVTYMTLSYIDSKITIPCSCNKEKRTPTSMLMRSKNPDIYQNTVTAEVYKEYNEHCKPSFKIIENTVQETSSTQQYHFVYDNQKDRIKSSVVLPVLSHKNELLGTLVVHCNSTSFFKEDQRLFWYEILQLFASEIGKNKLLLDATVKKGSEPF